MRWRGVNHVEFAVLDYDASIEFYRTIRGFAKSRPDLANTVPGVTLQARRTLPPRAPHK